MHDNAQQQSDARLFSTMGFDSKGAAYNRASLFSAAGLEWPEGADMEFPLGRFTNYPFSIDISNNRILAALDRSGCIRRAVEATGLDDVRGTTIPGVYLYKRLAFCEGHIGTTIRIDDRTSSAPALTFLEGVIPVFTSMVNDVNIRTTIFAPQQNAIRPSRIVQLMHITNQSTDFRHLHIIPVCDIHGNTTTTRLHASCMLLDENPDITDGTTAQIERTLAPRQDMKAAFIVDFSETARDTQAVHGSPTLQQLEEALTFTLRARIPSNGRLHVPEDPWYGELLTRAGELARQSMLLLDDETSAGSFWGSNANPLPDVWIRDFGYSTLGLIESDPDLANRAIMTLARYGIPASAWQRESKQHPEANGLEHSIGNACLAAVLASMLISRHGADSLTATDEAFDAYLLDLAKGLISRRPHTGGLYRTLYISDGPSRGDFHTGSNVLVWRAIMALIHDFPDRLTPDICDELIDIANELRQTINSICVRNLEGKDMFVEGVNEDGSIIGVHDGEESDLTLASVYGFADRDDARIRAHARWAHSPADPYYARITGGIDFWDFDDSNGVTYPGHIHALCGAGSRAELAETLLAIRRTTDVDGSFWWWPFEHVEADPCRVKRGLGKCGWCAGEFVSFMMHDIIGIRRHAKERSITIAPYTPWHEFILTDLAFLDGTIDIQATDTTLSITNRTTKTLNVTMQIPLYPGQMLENAELNGQTRRYQAEVVYLRDCAAVRTKESAPAGETLTLEITVR